MFKFTKAQHSFFGSNASFAPPYLAHSPFRGFALGDLGLHVATEIMRATAAYRSYLGRMRLVNIQSHHSGFSYGYVDTRAPRFGFMVLTFAFGRIKTFPDASRLVQRPINNRVCFYGTQEDQLQFLSVIVPATVVSKHHISNLQPRALKYMYMGLGVILRSIFRRFSVFALDEGSFENYHEKLTTQQSVGQLPLPNIFQTLYERWIWQRSIWMICPNVIARDTLNPYSVARVLDVLPLADIDRRNAAYDLVYADEENTVFDHVKKSMLRFIAAVQTQDRSIPDQSGLLFPALLYSLVFEGKVGFAREVTQIYHDLIAAYDERQADLATLFAPHDTTVRNLLNGDEHTVSRLTEALDIFN